MGIEPIYTILPYEWLGVTPKPKLSRVTMKWRGILWETIPHNIPLNYKVIIPNKESNLANDKGENCIVGLAPTE